MAFRRRALLSALSLVMLVACTGANGGGTPTSPPATAGTPAGTSSPGTPSQASAPVIPGTAELVEYLASPSDLGPSWSLWEGFASWPGRVPGAIPEDERALLPQVPMCPSGGESAVSLAEGLPWQAFTQLHQESDDPFATLVVAQQMLLADEPDQTTATFATLRDGLTGCLTENLPRDWEIGLRESIEIPAVGDDHYAERSASFDPGEARRDTRLVLVRDGPVLMLIQIDEVLISADATASLTQETVDAITTAMANKLA